MSDGCQRVSAVLHQWMLWGRRDPIVTWDWGWFGPMWMNDPLGVMRMKWQIQEEQRHGLICHSQLCPHFQNIFILWVLADLGSCRSQGHWEIILVLKLFGRVETDPNAAILIEIQPVSRNSWGHTKCGSLDFSLNTLLIAYNEYNDDVLAYQGRTRTQRKNWKISF